VTYIITAVFHNRGTTLGYPDHPYAVESSVFLIGLGLDMERSGHAAARQIDTDLYHE